MSDVEFPLFDSSITRHGRAWHWCVSGEAGEVVLQGMERSRPAAQYMAARATFLLLLTAPYRRRTNCWVKRAWLGDLGLRHWNALAERSGEPHGRNDLLGCIQAAFGEQTL